MTEWISTAAAVVSAIAAAISVYQAREAKRARTEILNNFPGATIAAGEGGQGGSGSHGGRGGQGGAGGGIKF